MDSPEAAATPQAPLGALAMERASSLFSKWKDDAQTFSKWKEPRKCDVLFLCASLLTRTLQDRLTMIFGRRALCKPIGFKPKGPTKSPKGPCGNYVISK